VLLVLRCRGLLARCTYQSNCRTIKHMSVHDLSHIHRLAPSEDTVDMLRQLLALAESGECISAHVIWQDNRDKWHQSRCMIVSDIPKLIGLLHMQIVNLTTRSLTGESMMADDGKIV